MTFRVGIRVESVDRMVVSDGDSVVNLLLVPSSGLFVASVEADSGALVCGIRVVKSNVGLEVTSFDVTFVTFVALAGNIVVAISGSGVVNLVGPSSLGWSVELNTELVAGSCQPGEVVGSEIEVAGGVVSRSEESSVGVGVGVGEVLFAGNTSV